MAKMREIELILILGLYYFDKGKNVEIFTRRLNQYFNKDVGTQTILFSIAKFRNIDPANNINLKIENNEYNLIWDEYIGKDRIQELKDIYRSFKKGMFVNENNRLNNIPKVERIVIKNIDTIIINDFPQEKPMDYLLKGINAYKRNREVVTNTLAYASYLCEVECTTELFLRKEDEINYTEAHHLIPLCYQDEFDYSLDVEANMVSLCPNCHRRLHYGFEPKEILRKLYEERKERLKACGIDISFEKLLLLYR